MAVAGSVLGRINFALVGDLPLTVVELAEEARLVAEMACGAIATLLDGDHDRVGVAIDPDFADDLEIAGFLALAPELVARAREIAGAAGGYGFGETLAIHERDSQNAMAQVIDRNRGHDAALFFEVDYS